MIRWCGARRRNRRRPGARVLRGAKEVTKKFKKPNGSDFQGRN
jgi:hypothetical protein